MTLACIFLLGVLLGLARHGRRNQLSREIDPVSLILTSLFL